MRYHNFITRLNFPNANYCNLLFATSYSPHTSPYAYYYCTSYFPPFCHCVIHEMLFLKCNFGYCIRCLVIIDPLALHSASSCYQPLEATMLIRYSLSQNASPGPSRSCLFSTCISLPKVAPVVPTRHTSRIVTGDCSASVLFCFQVCSVFFLLHSYYRSAVPSASAIGTSF